MFYCRKQVKKEAADVEREVPVELAAVEADVLGEIANIFMGSAATALSILLGKKTVITAPRVVLTTPEKNLEQISAGFF